jgi:hypothetical protein
VPPCGARRLQRESAQTAPIGERRHRGRAQGAAGRHGAMMALARRPLVVVMSGAFGSASACRRVGHPAGPDADSTSRSPAGGQFRRQQTCRSSRPPACGWGCALGGRRRIHCLRSVGRRGRTIFRMPAIRPERTHQ